MKLRKQIVTSLSGKEQLMGQGDLAGHALPKSPGTAGPDSAQASPQQRDKA